MKKLTIAKISFRTITIVNIVIMLLFTIDVWFDFWKLPAVLLLAYLAGPISLLGWFVCWLQLQKSDGNVVNMDLQNSPDLEKDKSA